MAARGYVTREEIQQAKSIDLLSYLQCYEPNELVRCGSGYCTRSHDSLKISNGLWHWHSRGIGGKTALDYLIHVRGMDFVSAVQQLNGNHTLWQSVSHNEPILQPKPFMLPEKYPDSSRAVRYLMCRGIDFDVIARCLENETIYESDRYHNAVFVGRDMNGTPRYAMQRSTGGKDLKLEISGSDKHYSFSMEGTGAALVVAESAIDALSIATLLKDRGKKWRSIHYLSLGGVSAKQKTDELPKALAQYLIDHPSIQFIRLMLDNDEAGRRASVRIIGKLSEQYDIKAAFPQYGKDFNEELQYLQTQRTKERRGTER